MYPLLPINLRQSLENKPIKEDSPFNTKNEQINQKPTLIIVDEQPPKIQDIKLINKSPKIDLFYEEMHFVGKLHLNRKKYISFHTNKYNTYLFILNNLHIIIVFQYNKKKKNILVNSVDMPTDKTACFLCQSILNYIQQAVTDPKSEEEVRVALEKSCVVVPSSFKQQCIQFIDQYSDAIISLLAQEVDPSIVSA